MDEMNNNGSWGWLILIFLFFLGFGNGGYGGNSQLNNDFITRDLGNINQNVLAQGCQTRESVMQSRYDTLLGFKDMQGQMASCCCDLKTAIHAEGEETRNMIMQDKIEALRESMHTAITAYNNLELRNSIVSALKPNCGCQL